MVDDSADSVQAEPLQTVARPELVILDPLPSRGDSRQASNNPEGQSSTRVLRSPSHDHEDEGHSSRNTPHPRREDWREMHAAVAEELRRIDEAMGEMRQQRRGPRHVSTSGNSEGHEEISSSSSAGLIGGGFSGGADGESSVGDGMGVATSISGGAIPQGRSLPPSPSTSSPPSHQMPTASAAASASTSTATAPVAFSSSSAAASPALKAEAEGGWTSWVTSAAVALVSLGALASALTALLASVAPSSPSALAGLCSKMTALATAMVVGAGTVAGAAGCVVGLAAGSAALLSLSAEVIVRLAISLGSQRRRGPSSSRMAPPYGGISPRLPSMQDLARFRSYCRDLAASLAVLPRDIGVMVLQGRSAGTPARGPAPSSRAASVPPYVPPPPPLPGAVMAQLDEVRREAAARMAEKVYDDGRHGRPPPPFDGRIGWPSPPAAAAAADRSREGSGNRSASPSAPNHHWSGPSTFI